MHSHLTPLRQTARKLLPLLSLLLCLLLGSCGKNLTTEQQDAVDKACAAAQASIETHAQAIEDSILERKTRTKDVADAITGYRAMWKRLWDGKEALDAHVRDTISADLISENDVKNAVAKQSAQFIKDLLDVEDTLALETGCPGLSVARHAQATHKPGAVAVPELGDAMQKQVYTELASLIGGEAATQLALSAGILGTSAAFSWETLGISLAVGVLVDVVVRWITDPSGKVAEQLDSSLEKLAKEQGDHFRNAMYQVLEKRKNAWIDEISDLN